MDDNSFKDPQFAQLYDLMMKANDSFTIELDFWKASAEYYGDPILELGCGTGRILLPLAQLGYDITGIDISYPMLAVLKQKLINCPSEIQKKIHLVQGDMSNKTAPGRFNLIIFAVSSFLALKNDDERLSCLNNCNQLLSDHGALILSNSKFEKNIVASSPEKEIIIDHDNVKKRFTVSENEWHEGAFIDFLYFTTVSTGITEKYHWSLYPIEDCKMKELIQTAGLQLVMPDPSLISKMREGAWFYICQKRIP